MNLKGVAVEKDKKANTISICATYEMPEVKGELEIDYLIMPNTGAMKVSQEFDASDDAKVSDLLVVVHAVILRMNPSHDKCKTHIYYNKV